MVFVDGPITISAGMDDEARFLAELKWLDTQVEGTQKTDHNWNSSIIGVGPGRRFAVEGTSRRFIITAARNLPHLPPCDITSTLIYPALLGPPLGERTVPAWLLFVDPVTDIAVLGVPTGDKAEDPGGWTHDKEKYCSLTNAATQLPIGGLSRMCSAWMPLLDAGWFRCILAQHDNDWRFYNHFGDLESLIPGLPLVADNECAIGLICDTDDWNEDIRHARLASALPGWLLHELAVPIMSSGARYRFRYERYAGPADLPPVSHPRE
jgi:hypothetical protein